MPVTPKASVSLIELLRPKDATPASSAKGSRGSPGEFDGLLERIRKTDGTRPVERPDAAKASERVTAASEPVPTTASTSTSPTTRSAPSVELVSATRTGTPVETPSESATPPTEAAATATLPPPPTSSATPTAVSDAPETLEVVETLPSTSVEPLTPEEIAAVLKERDALVAILAKTPSVAGSSPTVAVVADPATLDETIPAVATLPTELVAAVVDATVAKPVEPAPVVIEAMASSPTTLLAVASESSDAETKDTVLLTTTTGKVGKDYLAALNGEERISTTGLLRALEATVLDESSSEAAPITWRSGVLPGSEGMARTGLAVPEPQSNGSVLRTLGMNALLDGNPADTRLTTPPSASFLRATSRNAPLQTLTGTIPVLEGSNLRSVPNRETTSANAGLSVEGATPSLTESPLQRAQEAILRRAAHVAFFERNGAAQGVGTPEESRRAMSLDNEPMVREMARALERPVESLVRAERARMRVRSLEPSEGGVPASDRTSPEFTSRVASQNATPPVASASAPVTTASVSATPQAHAPLMEQVAQEARRNVRLGRREFRIQLNPDNLGSVELEVVWDHDVVKVKITAASKESQKILEDNIVELERALQRQGLGFDADLPWKASDGSADARPPIMDLRSARWTWRPGLTVTR